MSWLEAARCLGAPLTGFFTEGGTDTARDTCQQCPVWQQCLTFGLNERYGVWGGYAPRQRADIRAGRASWPTAPAAELEPVP